MKIARVFPTKTKMCPDDKDAYFGPPNIFTPRDYDEVHISVTFTWDIPKIDKIVRQWHGYAKKIRVHGPALDNAGRLFEPGMYLKHGVTITSRGCPKKCSFCFVPEREGGIRELKIRSGHIIQDNNLLACSKSHIRKVFEMLRHQKRIDFSGGLESSRITDKIIKELRGLKIHQLWLSYDHPGAVRPLKKAVEKLSRCFSQRQIRCYVMIGYKGDTIDEAESRLLEAWDMGTLPFAMRYRQDSDHWEDSFVFRERAWNELTARWTQPKTIFSRMKRRIR